MKIFLLSCLALSLIVSSCSLNATQEASLNNAKTSFINSKNNGTVMSYVAFTLPEVVSYYKNQSDSIFQQRFDLSSKETTDFLSNGNIRVVEESSSLIHVKYEFTNVNFEDVSQEKVIVFALSDNAGKSWFFAEENDYFNDDILPDSKRLIKE